MDSDIYEELSPLLEAMDRQNREKEAVANMRKEFSANVSHELKTPLTSISGYAEIMKNGLVRPEDISGFSERIYKEARRLITLIEDIIKLSKLDEESEYYSRFVTHLKYLTYRLFTGTGYETHGEEDEELFEMITRKYADEYKCAKRIALFVDKELNFILPDEELMYLTIHIRKITYKKPT